MISSELDSIADSIRQTEQTMNHLQFVTVLGYRIWQMLDSVEYDSIQQVLKY